MKRFLPLLGFGVAVALCICEPVSAEESFADILKRATELREKGNYPKAMAELDWAKKDVEKLHFKKLEGFFPASAGEFTGGKFKSDGVMGIVTVEREYASAGGMKMKASLAGAAASGGAAQQGMAALAGFANMAAMMGGQGNGTETVRVKGNVATFQNTGNRPELTIPLASGLMLQVEAVSGKVLPTKEQIIAVAEGFDVVALETYLTAK